MSLRAKSFRAVFWIAIAKYSAKGLSVLTQLVLARLLAPQAFGLIAVAFVVLNVIQILNDMGLCQTLIVRKDETPRVLNAAFYLSMMIGVALFGLTLLGAPLAAKFFNNDTVTPLLRFMSILLIVTSFNTVPSAILQKHLRFRTLVWPPLVGQMSFALTSIPLAMAGYDVWSFAWGSLVGGVAECGLTCLLARWRPTLQFDWTAARELLSYSKHVVNSSLGTMLQRNLDTIIIGRMLGMTPVGYYNLAFSLANALPVQLTTPLGPVLLPTYSQIQDQPERLARLHLRLDKYLLLALTLLSLGVCLLAEDGIMTFYGATWKEAIVPLRILCLYALIRNVATMNGPVLLVIKKAKELSFSVYLSVACIAAFSYPAMKLAGIAGMSLLMVAVISVSASLTFYLVIRGLRAEWRSYANLLVVPTLAATASALSLALLAPVLGLRLGDYSKVHLLTNALIVAVKAGILTVSYVLVVYATDKQTRADVRANLSHLLTRRTLGSFLRES